MNTRMRFVGEKERSNDAEEENAGQAQRSTHSRKQRKSGRTAFQPDLQPEGWGSTAILSATKSRAGPNQPPQPTGSPA